MLIVHLVISVHAKRHMLTCMPMQLGYKPHKQKSHGKFDKDEVGEACNIASCHLNMD